MEDIGFSVSRLSRRDQVLIARRLFREAERLTKSVEDKDALNEIISDIHSGLQKQKIDRVGTRDVADRIDLLFDGALEMLRNTSDKEKRLEDLEFFLLDLKDVLSGRFARPSLAYRFALTAPPENHPSHPWCSSKAEALDLQRRLRVAVSAVSSLSDLQDFRGIVLRNNPCEDEIALAGAALSRGIPVAADRSPLTCISSFETAEDALRDVIARAYGPARMTDPEKSEKDLFDALENLAANPLADDADRQSLMLRCELLSELLEKSRTYAFETADRSAIRSANYIEIVRGTDLERPFFDIYANGSTPKGAPDAVSQLARALRKIRGLENRLLEPRGEAPADDSLRP